MAHDELEEAKMGDTVRVIPSRPMSKMKRHKLIDILKREPRLSFEKEKGLRKIESPEVN
jgi:hypothetical protein